MDETTTASSLFLNMTIMNGTEEEICNVTDNTVTSRSDFEYKMGIIVAAVFSIVALVGLIGNLLVIIVVISNKQMRNTTNILIISLAIADLSFIILCVPFTAITQVVTVYPFGTAWCQVVNYMTFVSAYVSIYTLVLMSFDRYLAVVHAIAAINHRTERNAVIAVIIIWVFLLVANAPIFFLYKVIHYKHECQERAACLIPGQLETKVVYYMFFAFGYMVPLLLVVVLYGLMVYRLLFSTPMGLSQSSETIRGKRRVTKMIVIVIVIFALCWLPNQIVFLYLQIHGHPFTRVFVVLMNVSRILAYTNSCVNPILYAFLSENFRKGFRKILCMDSRRTTFHGDTERTNTRPLLNAPTHRASNVGHTVQTTVNGL